MTAREREQQIQPAERAAPTYERTWEIRRRGGRSVSDESRTSYYGIPPIHKPHWKWEIILYFFLGGISGASYVVATIAHLFGGREGERIARVGRYISFAALIPSPLLLIKDLGRPERFHHMLRIIKLRSPMSVGTWGLTTFGGFCTLSVLCQAASDGLLRSGLACRILTALPARLIGVIGSVFAFFVSGYTGVLLAATAVPLWAKNYLLMGPLFLSSALSNAATAMTLALSLGKNTSAQTLKRLERLDMVARLAELGLLLATRKNLGPIIGRPLREGRYARMHMLGVIGLGIVAPTALQAPFIILGKHASRLVSVLSSLMTLAGGLLFRYVILKAGYASADDPQATFEFARRNGHKGRME